VAETDRNDSPVVAATAPISTHAPAVGIGGSAMFVDVNRNSIGFKKSGARELNEIITKSGELKAN
jgi:hypothetical protein